MRQGQHPHYPATSSASSRSSSSQRGSYKKMRNPFLLLPLALASYTLLRSMIADLKSSSQVVRNTSGGNSDHEATMFILQQQQQQQQQKKPEIFKVQGKKRKDFVYKYDDDDEDDDEDDDDENFASIYTKASEVSQQQPAISAEKDDDDADDVEGKGDDDGEEDKSPESIEDKKTPVKKQVRTAKEKAWEPGLKPSVVWLASFPNSGTSYTMTMVERGSDLSTASNYGAEVTFGSEDSIPIFPQHPEGPYWDGLSGKMGKIRQLPTTNVLTKTHCGGRCVDCGADQYVTTTEEFLKACQRTTSRQNGKKHVEMALPASSIAGVVHLVRDPFHNTVARFHLTQRHTVNKQPKLIDSLPRNAKGFQNWCSQLDTTYAEIEKEVFSKKDPHLLQLMQKAPCRAEFYKYTMWHNLLIDAIPLMGKKEADIPVLTVHYENYMHKYNETTAQIFEFLDVPIAAELRPFRSLPDYSDHFSDSDLYHIKTLVEYVATDATWTLIQHYFDAIEEESASLDEEEQEAEQ